MRETFRNEKGKVEIFFSPTKLVGSSESSGTVSLRFI